MKKLLFLGLLAMSLFSCENESDSVLPVDNTQKAEMIVVNEGQYTKGTGSITAIYRDGTVAEEAFQSVNKRPLGDVAQSINYINGLYYITVKNSGKVEVVKPDTYESVATIEVGNSPMDITPLDKTHALVSSFKINTSIGSVSVVNLETNKVEKSVEVGKQVSFDHMVTVKDKVFSLSGGTLYIFDVNNITEEGMRFVDLDYTSGQTRKIIVDKNDKLWILGRGWKVGGVVCVDPDTEKVIYTYEFKTTATNDADYVDGCITRVPDYGRIDGDKDGENIYFNLDVLKGTNNAYPIVYRFNTTTKTFGKYTEMPDLGMMYGMGVDNNGNVYVCDCLDYSAQKGYIRQYKDNKLLKSTKVGIYPNQIFFTDKIKN